MTGILRAQLLRYARRAPLGWLANLTDAHLASLLRKMAPGLCGQPEGQVLVAFAVLVSLVGEVDARTERTRRRKVAEARLDRALHLMVPEVAE